MPKLLTEKIIKVADDNFDDLGQLVDGFWQMLEAEKSKEKTKSKLQHKKGEIVLDYQEACAFWHPCDEHVRMLRVEVPGIRPKLGQHGIPGWFAYTPPGQAIWCLDVLCYHERKRFAPWFPPQ